MNFTRDPRETDSGESIETSGRFQKEPSGAGERFKGSRVSYERATREQEEDKEKVPIELPESSERASREQVKSKERAMRKQGGSQGKEKRSRERAKS